MCKLLNEKSFLFAALLLSAVSMSCSKDPDETDKPNKPDDHNIIEWGDSAIDGDATMGMMKFNVENGISVRRSLTRGYNSADGTSYTLEKDDIVTIEMSSALQSTATKNYLASTTGDATAGGSGIALTYAGTDGFYWKSQSETVNIRAWSYGNGSTSTADPDGQTFTLPQDQSSGYQELLYSPLQTNIPYTTGHSGISLTMYHQLARIVVSIEYDNGVSSLSSITIGDGSATIPRTATFTKPVSPGYYGTWSGFGSQTDPITPKTETANTCYSAVLIPWTYAAGTKLFVITIGSETFAYKLDADLEMEAGKQYNYTVKIKNKKIEVTSEIHPWGTNNSAVTKIANPYDIKLNPLWYVSKAYAESYNSSTKVVTLGIDPTAHSYAGWTWAAAMANFAYQSTSYTEYHNAGVKDSRDNSITYHLPTCKEMLCLIPHMYSDARAAGIFSNSWVPASSVYSEPTCSFGYDETTKSGINGKSYWSSYTPLTFIRYAIRFLDTKYCSAWRYMMDTENEVLIVSAHLIQPVSETEAASKLTEVMNKGDDYWEDNEEFGSVQRVFAAAGLGDAGASGPGTLTRNFSMIYIFTATEISDTWAIFARIEVGSDCINVRNGSDNRKTYSLSVRLFRDN